LDEASGGGGEPAMGSVRLLVNGTEHVVQCPSDTPLLYVLRNDLGLMGTRFGCGLGLCGACNVLVAGRPVHSCETPVSFVEGQDVTTVEGLSDGDSLHPVQQSFVDHQAFQCGYCSSGIVITAAALLARDPDADEGRLRAALDGNLCRCGAHLRILRAIRSLQASLSGAST
jgi:nicotinate dehydrogenase subunit A